MPATIAPAPDSAPYAMSGPSSVPSAGSSEGQPIVQAQNQNQNGGNGDDAKPNSRVDCRAAAQRAVDDAGGQLLSVRLSGGQCVITILVPGTGDNARPRKMTVQVSR